MHICGTRGRWVKRVSKWWGGDTVLEIENDGCNVWEFRLPLRFAFFTGCHSVKTILYFSLNRIMKFTACLFCFVLCERRYYVCVEKIMAGSCCGGLARARSLGMIGCVLGLSQAHLLAEFFNWKICICLLYHSLILRLRRQVLGVLPEDDEDPFFLRSQCRDCWWPGNIGSQGIRSHNIALAFAELFGIPSGKITCLWALGTAQWWITLSSLTRLSQCVMIWITSDSQQMA